MRKFLIEENCLVVPDFVKAARSSNLSPSITDCVSTQQKRPESKVTRILFIIIANTFTAFDKTQKYLFEMGSDL